MVSNSRRLTRVAYPAYPAYPPRKFQMIRGKASSFRTGPDSHEAMKADFGDSSVGISG